MESRLSYSRTVPPLKMVGPSVLMCIGQGLFLFFLGLYALLLPVEHWEPEGFAVIYVIFSFAGWILTVVGSSIAIARFSSAGMPISGPVCLLIGSALMLGLVIGMGGSIAMACRGGDDFRGIDIAFILASGSLLVVGLYKMQKLVKPIGLAFKGLCVALGAMLLFAIAIIAIDPEYHYEWNSYYFDSGYISHADGVRVAKIIFGILCLSAMAIVVVGWSKAANVSHIEQGVSRDMSNPTGSPVKPGLTVEQVVQMQQWASGLSTDELKYVILNPAMYQPEVIDICTRELGKRQ